MQITLDSSKHQLGCTMQRHQFPVKPVFSEIIYKAQDQGSKAKQFKSTTSIYKKPS